MNIYVKQFGKLFLGIAIVIISLFPLLMGSYFFFLGCDYQAWGELFLTDGVPTNEPLVTAVIGLVTAVFLGICVWGFTWMLSSTRYTKEEQIKDFRREMDKVLSKVAECDHKNLSLDDSETMIQCNDCGMITNTIDFMFENKC